jgi:hypothetical protein
MNVGMWQMKNGFQSGAIFFMLLTAVITITAIRKYFSRSCIAPGRTIKPI